MAGQDRRPTLKFSSKSADVNFAGKVSDGTGMKWVNLTAYVLRQSGAASIALSPMREASDW